MSVRFIRAAAGRAIVASTLVLGFLAVTAHVVSAATPPNYYVSATGGSTAAFNCRSFAAVHACSLSRVLSLATAAGDVIHMKAGTYGATGNDVINALTGLSASNSGVIIKGAAGLGTILAPASSAADCAGQNGIIDFSPVSNMTIERLKVDFSAASGCANPVYNSGGTGDTLGGTKPKRRVFVTGTPTTAWDLVGGSTTLTNLNLQASSYTTDGVVCSGPSTTCTISHSTINGGGAPGTTGIVVGGGASATISTSTISDNTDDGILLQNVTGTSISGDTITGNAGDGVYNYQTNGVTMTGDTITNNAGGGVINDDTTGGMEDCTESGNYGGGTIFINATGGIVSGCTISGNTAGGVLLQGSTGQSITGNTISGNAGGGVLVQESSGASITNNNPITNNAAGGVVSQDPPASMASTPCTNTSEIASPCQNTGNVVSGNTFDVSDSGQEAAGVELEQTGGFTIENNVVSNLGEGGEGFVLVGSDNDTISTNTVTSSAAGVFITGNDITGPSEDNVVGGTTTSLGNTLSDNLLAGAAADGYGSPESWDRPGTENQGIQGEVFFQSSVALGVGLVTNVCPASDLYGSDCEVDTPAGMGNVTDAYSGVAEYLATQADLCPTGVTLDGQSGTLSACTDGSGDILLTGAVSSAITAGNGEATGPSTTLEPGCEANPPADTGEPSCTGTVLTLSILPYINTVASGNMFENNTWDNETIAGAIDGSGPNGQFVSNAMPFTDSDPSPPGNTLQNTWMDDMGSPSGDQDPSWQYPAAGG